MAGFNARKKDRNRVQEGNIFEGLFKYFYVTPIIKLKTAKSQKVTAF